MISLDLMKMSEVIKQVINLNVISKILGHMFVVVFCEMSSEKLFKKASIQDLL